MSAGGVQLRAEEPGDHGAVRDVHRTAFGDGGAVVAGLVDALRADLPAEAVLSLVAETGDRVVGHVMFTPSLLDAPR